MLATRTTAFLIALVFSFPLAAQFDTSVVDSVFEALERIQSDSVLRAEIIKAYRPLGREVRANPAANRYYLKKGLKLTDAPENAGIFYRRLINAFQTTGQTDSAIVYTHEYHDFLIAVSDQHNPKHQWMIAELQKMYLKKGWYEKAITFADSMVQVEALQDYPKLQLYLNRAQAYIYLTDYPSALAAARDFLNAIPDDGNWEPSRLHAMLMLADISELTNNKMARRRWMAETQNVNIPPRIGFEIRLRSSRYAAFLLDEGEPYRARQLLDTSRLLELAFDKSYDEDRNFIATSWRHIPLPTLITHLRSFLATDELSAPGLLRDVARVEELIEKDLKYESGSARPSLLAVIADYYSKTDNHQKALTVALTRLEESKAAGTYRQSTLEALSDLHRLQAAAGQPEAAYVTLQDYQQVEDSLTSRGRNFLFAQAARAIDLDEATRARENAERATLAEREAAALRSRNFWLALLAAGLVIAAVAVAWSRSRRAQRAVATQKAVVDQSLAEKEVLLREIHHRVKNNLQIISSLLQKQARVAGDDGAKDFAKQGQERIQSMALVHENLYQSEQLNGVNIRDYLTDLAANIKRGHDGPETAVDLDLRVANETLDLDTAIPVGLILNELLTNAYKYAFAGRDAGKITVAFGKEGGNYRLQVNDNGVGLPADHEQRRKTSLGHNLVSGLVRQLEGTIEWLGGKPSGTTVNITF